tara:strand:- start:236 stop:715 length:480 start_codon:yes stop_codon:yes gene_type:complete
MERISSFKDFNSIYVERNQQITVEENENKRNAIADRVKSIMSEMEISKLTDLDEETKIKFVDTLFSEEVAIEEPETETVEESCGECGKADCVCETEESDEDEEVSEAEITTDDQFQEYAMTILKKAHGDDFDEEKAQKAIDGLKSKFSGDYGAMVGALS